MNKVIVSGVGCCLVDRIYDHIDFTSEAFSRVMSRKPGDGGLEPGKLEFEEEVERFTGKKFSDLLPTLTGGRQADKENIGGPCIVALIHAAQLAQESAEVRFYGCRGEDEVGEHLLAALRRTPVSLSHYRTQPQAETASTVVLSDPDYDGGHGERTFVNTIGASWHYLPEELDDSFCDADICVFGGTAIVPRIHEGLTEMLQAAKAHGALTVVNTVYDSLSERKNPGGRWPLGRSDESYALTDLLIVDKEEALRLSGQTGIPQAVQFFIEKGAKAVLVTNGSRDVYLSAAGGVFGDIPLTTMPVSRAVTEEIMRGHKGDSTGCGDNFAGGAIASLCMQMSLSPDSSQGEGDRMADGRCLDLREACRWGIVSGGYACFYYGGTYFETRPGEKMQLIRPLYEQYLEQTKL